nr:hypothetical protein [Tanacetum cinerariifolium]
MKILHKVLRTLTINVVTGVVIRETVSSVDDILVSLVGKVLILAIIVRQKFCLSLIRNHAIIKTLPPVILQTPQETSVEILHDHENVINSVQTYLRKFDRFSFFKTPKVLLIAWDRVFEIKNTIGNKQYKPENVQELFRKLLNDVQNIHEELAEYINIPSWNCPAFSSHDDDDDDDDENYTIPITPEEPDNSL